MRTYRRFPNLLYRRLPSLPGIQSAARPEFQTSADLSGWLEGLLVKNLNRTLTTA